MNGVERELEDRLYELDDVLAARVTSDPGTDGPEVKLLVRPTADVESLRATVLQAAEAHLGVPAESLSVHVVPLGPTVAEARGSGRERAFIDLREPSPAQERVLTATARIQLHRVLGASDGTTFEVEVSLQPPDGEVATGRAHGSAYVQSLPRTVATAAVDALARLPSVPFGLHLHDAGLCSFGPSEIAVVTVLIVQEGSTTTAAGAAEVRSMGPMDGVARAVLDAVNRRIAAPRVRGREHPVHAAQQANR